MKIRLSLFCVALALLACTVVDAQIGQHRLLGGGFARSAFSQVSGDLLTPQSSGTPGRLWFEANAADEGLGFRGSYLTIGAKTRLFEDRLDGRWLFEGQFNHSLEDDGGAFANIGIERVFSIDAAGADIAMGFWYDYDGDEMGNFSHEFHQVGVSGSIKTRKWDLIGNGYFPTGVTDYLVGELNGQGTPFTGNNIALVPGVDSALKGFDVTLRMRPKQLAFANGTFDLGGYHYNSDLIDAFGGGRVRLGFQAFKGMMVNLEVNHDERFDTTGVLGVGWVFGANASGYGHEYSGIGRDLEQTVRNDHIVRFQQDFELAIDPLTGAPYNVVHVDNTADATIQLGTAELPFADLITAQNLSGEGDIIFVHTGDGTDRNYDRGIALQDNQRLFGESNGLTIPVQGGVLFPIVTDPLATPPTISNNGGFAVVQLADNNEVAGLNIDGAGARFGIWGEGTSGNIHDNTIFDANEDGVRLAGVDGNWSFARNTVRDNGSHGVFVFDALDTTSEFNFEENVMTGNGLDGIHFRNFDPASFVMLSNQTNNNLRNGLFLENYLNSLGNGLQLLAHQANGNASNGIFLNVGSGNLNVLNTVASNNLGAGLLIRNWATATPERITIATTTGGVSTLSGNGAPANLQFVYDNPLIDAEALVTGLTISDGTRGIGARIQGVTAGGDRTEFEINIIDNLEISRHINDGIRLVALDGALITSEIGNSDPTNPLNILDNGSGGGSGIAMLAQGPNGQPPAEIRALIDNVNINNAINRIIRPGLPDLVVATNGILATGLDNSVYDLTVTNSTIGAPNGGATRDTQNGINMNFDVTNSVFSGINRVRLDNLSLFNDVGVSLTTGTGTFTDMTLSNSTILPNGAQSTAGTRSDNNPFTDGTGTNGVVINTNGLGVPTGQLNVFLPDLPLDFSGVEIASDGVVDNLTRVNLINNTIQDFTEDGVTVASRGDSHVLFNMTGNRLQNNGAGFDDDVNDDNIYNDINATGSPNDLFFYDGVNIDVFDQSVMSVRIVNNVFVDNFERGLSLNTFNAGTLNALVESNTLFGNDRGEDNDNIDPLTGTGNANTGGGPLADSGFADFEAINNEEFYRRAHETTIILNANGNPGDGFGNDLPNDTPGILLPTNGNPAFALGAANLNLSMSNNALQLGPDIQDFSLAPGEFQLGLDGLTNGFTGPFPGVVDAPFNLANGLIVNEENFFTTFGF